MFMKFLLKDSFELWDGHDTKVY